MSVVTNVAPQNASITPRQDLALLPTADEWVEHAKLLLKFWLQDEAKGNPIGNFPTWRNNDGTLIGGATQDTNLNSTTPNSAPANLTHEAPRDLKILLAHYCVDINTLLKRQYVRMMSRQTFAYGALFNLTGDQEALKLHEAGVRYLLDHARDEHGIFYTFFTANEAHANVNSDEQQFSKLKSGHPKLEERAIQDLCGATLGLAMNVYLTHSQESLDAIETIRKYIYTYCADEHSRILKWVLKDFEADKAKDIQLSPQLDELNCYLLLLWRLLPKELKPLWQTSIDESLDIIDNYFTEPNTGRFYGSLTGDIANPNKIGQLANYGHGIKTWWMRDIAASLKGAPMIRAKALHGIAVYVKDALKPDGNFWYEDDERHDATWWIWAELDQAMLHAALVGQAPITGTVRTWTQKLTDRQYGEVVLGQKQHFWRNGYHSSEHALVGYILSQGIRGKYDPKAKVTLYFATKENNPNQQLFTPYYYSGDLANISNENGIQTVTFTGIRAPDAI